eukprot:465398-Hanusia_phi.AAC.5
MERQEANLLLHGIPKPSTLWDMDCTSSVWHASNGEGGSEELDSEESLYVDEELCVVKFCMMRFRCWACAY